MPKGQFNQELIEYCVAKGVREHSLLAELRAKSELLHNGRMLISREQGAFIALLARLMNVKSYLEIGIFTGYSTLWTALAMPRDSRITALDISDEHLGLAYNYWQQAGIINKIETIIAPARDSLQKLITNNFYYDLAFIDANKSDYLEYYEACLQLVRPGGLIIIDNVLMYGQILDENPDKNYVRILQKLNNLIKDDPRVEICMLPIGDGMTLAQKKV